MIDAGAVVAFVITAPVVSALGYGVLWSSRFDVIAYDNNRRKRIIRAIFMPYGG